MNKGAHHVQQKVKAIDVWMQQALWTVPKMRTNSQTVCRQDEDQWHYTTPR
jgi:hypothetical protein